jgi:hypothetical protein
MWGQRCGANHWMYVPLWGFLDSWLFVRFSLSCLMCLPSECNVMQGCNFSHPIICLFLSTIAYKEALWFFTINFFASCCNAFSCYSIPIYWNISKIMVWQTLTPQQYDKQLYIEKKYNAWKGKKNELVILLIDMDFDLERMCKLTIHPCISSTCIHMSNKFHFN